MAVVDNGIPGSMPAPRRGTVSAGIPDAPIAPRPSTKPPAPRPAAAPAKPQRKVFGSAEFQGLIDQAPALDAVRQDPEYLAMSPADRAEFDRLYHTVVTRNTTRYKTADPDRRAQMDSYLTGQDVGTVRQAYGMPAQPDYATDTRPAGEEAFPQSVRSIMSKAGIDPGNAGNVFGNALNRSTIGQAWEAVTGQSPFRTREAHGDAEKAAETGLGVVEGLVSFAAPGMALGKVAGAGLQALGAGERLARLGTGMAFGAGGGLVTSTAREGAALRRGDIDPTTGEPMTFGRALSNIGKDVLTGAAMGPIAEAVPGNSIGPAIRRNLYQTAAGQVGESLKGNQFDPMSAAIDFGSGALLDAWQGRFEDPSRFRAASNLDEAAPVQPQAPGEPLALPPGNLESTQPYGVQTAPQRPFDTRPIRTSRQVGAPEVAGLLPEGGQHLLPTGNLESVPGEFTRATVRPDARPLRTGRQLPEPDVAGLLPEPTGAYALPDSFGVPVTNRSMTRDGMVAEPGTSSTIYAGGEVPGPIPRPTPAQLREQNQATIAAELQAAHEEIRQVRADVAAKAITPSEGRRRIIAARERAVRAQQQGIMMARMDSPEFGQPMPEHRGPSAYDVVRQQGRDAEQRLRIAEEQLTQAHESGVETYKGKRSILTWKPERLRIMSDEQLRELTLDMADTDNAQAFRAAVENYIDARQELRYQRSPQSYEDALAENRYWDEQQRQSEQAAADDDIPEWRDHYMPKDQPMGQYEAPRLDMPAPARDPYIPMDQGIGDYRAPRMEPPASAGNGQGERYQHPTMGEVIAVGTEGQYTLVRRADTGAVEKVATSFLQSRAKRLDQSGQQATAAPAVNPEVARLQSKLASIEGRMEKLTGSTDRANAETDRIAEYFPMGTGGSGSNMAALNRRKASALDKTIDNAVAYNKARQEADSVRAQIKAIESAPAKKAAEARLEEIVRSLPIGAKVRGGGWDEATLIRHNAKSATVESPGGIRETIAYKHLAPTPETFRAWRESQAAETAAPVVASGDREAMAAVNKAISNTKPSAPAAPETPTVGQSNARQAAVMRKLADGLQASIDKYSNPGVANQNPTRRRTEQAAASYRQADKLKRLQTAYRAIADAAEAGTLPPVLSNITKRRVVEILVNQFDDGTGRGPRYSTEKMPAQATWGHHVKYDLQRAEKLPGAGNIVRVLKPVAAKGDVRVTLTDAQAEALSKLAKLEKKDDPFADRKALIESGIRYDEDFQAARKAIEDLMAGKAISPTQSPLEAKVRALQVGSKIPGYFATPPELANRMAQLLDVRPGEKVLEPSAGSGALIDALPAEVRGQVDAYEVSSQLRDILTEKGVNLAGRDFTEAPAGADYDKIIMNPPFENGQDIDHVRAAYDRLKPGGRMVAIMGEGAFFRSDRKATDFRAWLDEQGGTSEKLPEGSFKSSGTGTATRLVVIDKPAGDGVRHLHAGFPLPSKEQALRGIEGAAKLIGKASRLFDRGTVAALDRLGMIDANGDFAPGANLWDALERATMAKSDNATIDKIKAALVDKYGLPAEYLEARSQADMTRNQIAVQFQRFAAERLADLPPDQQKLVYNIVTDEAFDPGAHAMLRDDLRALVDELGQRAVDAGVISQESFNRNRGEYLARSYHGHEFGSKLAQGVANTFRRTSKWATSQLKGRGTTADMALSNLAKHQPIGRHPKTDNLLYEIGDHVWELVGKANGRAQFRRDWTPEERAKMGEIEDVTYAFLKTGAQLSKNIATGEFYQQLAEMPTIAQADASLTDAERSQLAAEGWVRVGSDNIEGTATKRWGALADHWIQRDVHRDLTQIQKMQSAPGLWRTVLREWKLNKTARNPVVHVNNVMSNFGLLEMNGGDADDVFEAMRIMGGYGSEADTAMLNQARELGVFNSTFLETEIAKVAASIGPVPAGMTLPEKALHYLKTADAWMRDAYQSEDEAFRFALFMGLVRKGIDQELAAKRAISGFVDYNITAPAINAARNSVLPFIGYAYRAIPMMAQGFAKRPWKVAKMILAWQGLNAAFSAMAGGNEDEERAAMDGTVRNARMHMRMPFQDESGQQRYLDTTRFIPGSELASGIAGAVMDQDLDSLTEGVTNTFSLGGPIVSAIDVARNVNPMTGKPIRNEATPGWRQAADLGNYLYEQAMPNNPADLPLAIAREATGLPIPASYSSNKILAAAMGNPDQSGRRDTVPLAAAATLGFKARPIDVEELKVQRAIRLRAEVNRARDVVEEAARALAKGKQGMTQEKLNRIIEQQRGVIQEAQRQFGEYEQGIAEARGNTVSAR